MGGPLFRDAPGQQLGPVDLLINNAGVAGPIGPIAEVEPAE